MPASICALPVIALVDDIAEALTQGNVLLQAQPGAGKSTGLPLALLLRGLVTGRILLLEPRRLAASLVARRLAAQLGESVGERIGLRMRGATRVSAATQLEVVTEGVLTRLLQHDPTLDGVALVIFDEFHERSLHADLGLALCLEVQRDLREDLRLLLMSATLETEQLREHIGEIKQYQCAVRQYPVEIIWVGENSSQLPQRIVKSVQTALHEQSGDVLVFLPGLAEIRRCSQLLVPVLPDTIDVHQLHSSAGSTQQSRATAPATADRRRVILSTSLAETSITIDGVKVVIDSGLERRGKVDAVTGSQRLETVSASRASATQRAGRAGRTAAGVCYRLWSESTHASRSAHWQPEIRRADLSALLVELGLWGVANADDLPWLEAPSSAGLTRAAELLCKLGLWHDGQLTSRGRLVAALPVHPRLGHMLLWAASHEAGVLACRLAVWLEENRPLAKGVDLEPLLRESLPKAIRMRVNQLQNKLSVIGRNQHSSMVSEPPATSTPSAAVILSQAYPDWIARRRPGQAGGFLLACGAGVVIDSEEPLAHCEWLAVAQLGGTGTQLRIFRAMALSIEELERFSPELFVHVDHVDWDDQRERVLAEHRLMIGGTVVSARPVQNVSDTDRAAALLVGIRRLGLSCLPWTDDCREWQARVQRMGEFTDQHGDKQWPTVDDETLLARLEHWLLPWLTGIGSLKAMKQLNLHNILNNLLDYRQQQTLDEWFPVRYQVPSGSRIKLTYIKPGNPVLSVRLQEMLGCSVNPAIARGLVQLKVELLSPASRPVQVTMDLVNFWTSSYPDVKKEMAGRYPKHVWPDDPLAALPTASAKRRK